MTLTGKFIFITAILIGLLILAAIPTGLHVMGKHLVTYATRSTRNKIRVLASIALAFSLLFLLLHFPLIANSFEIDSCLDRGGAWNEITKTCRLK